MAAKILVVDDDPNVQRLLQYTLKQEGYDVVIAGDGAEGFRLWGAESPDLALLRFGRGGLSRDPAFRRPGGGGAGCNRLARAGDAAPYGSLARLGSRLQGRAAQLPW